MRRPALLLALLAFAACGRGPAIPDRDLELRVTTPAEEVELGRAFPLTVVRVWRRDLVPEAWDEADLAPLVLRLTDQSRREDDRHVEETRHYRAYAFAPGRITVPGATFTARAARGGAPKSVSGNPLEIRVHGVLPADDAGTAELPDRLLREPIPWGVLAGAAGLLLVGAFLLRRRLRRPVSAPSPVPEPGPPPPSAADRARGRLRRLARAPVGTPEEIRAFYVEGARTLRDYLEERFSIPCVARTTEEALAARDLDRAVPAAPRERLAGVLGAADRVKFAGELPGDPEQKRLLDAAEQFLAETDGGPAGGGAS